MTRIVTAPNVRPVFQVAVGDVDVVTGQARYDADRYDEAPDATYAGLDAEWTDAGCDVIDAETWLGRQRSLDVFDVGTATVTVTNPAGMWDYPPVQVTPLTIRPGRQARVGVIVDDAPPAWLWHGWIDVTTPSYWPSGRSTVAVQCVCAKGEFGRVDVPRVAAPVGAGETVVARMNRLADVAEFPEHRRAFDGSGVTLVATSLGGRAGELADTAAKSAGGDVFGDETGMLRYVPRDWQTRGPDRPVDGAIGNRGVAGEICPDQWEIMFARSDFSSRVNYGRPGEEPSSIDDAANQVRFGVETWDMTAMETVDAGVIADLAARALRVRNYDLAPRIAAVTVNAARPGVAALLAAASPFTPSMYACGLVQAGRPVFARNLYLTGVAHTITAGSWTARLALDDARPWQIGADTRYDAANYDADVYSTSNA